jgi:hypothetical protein
VPKTEKSICFTVFKKEDAMYFERDEKGKVVTCDYNGNELRDLSRNVDRMFRQTIKELANTRVEIKITPNVENRKTG